MAQEVSDYLQHAAIVDSKREEPETRDLPHDMSRRSSGEEQEQSDIM